jgi:hypothetical protein
LASNDTGIEASVMDDGILGIPRRRQGFQRRSALERLIDELAVENEISRQKTKRPGEPGC